MGLFEDMLEYKVLQITNKLPKWLKDEELEIIISEHTFFETNRVEMFTETRSSSFVSSYVKVLRRKFKCEWYLATKWEKNPIGNLLVGKLPWSHYIVLAPFVLRDDSEE